MLDYLRLEIRRTLRDTGFVVFGIGLPVLMYLLFTNIGVSEDEGEWKASAMVGMAAYGALGAALGTGTAVADDRAHGWLRQLRVTPLTPREAVTGRALTGSVTVLPSIIAVMAAGALVNGVRLDAWQWPALVLLLWLGALPFTLLGLGNGYRLSTQVTGVVNMICTMGLAIVGGLWFPSELFPGWLRTLSDYTPAHSFADLGWSTTQGSAPGALTLGVLLGWLLLFGAYAASSYRRTARAA
ncbi:ABC transporter permease [Streptomyces sp. KLOTTS4A1]|uniref:ABC transporter permease n=1 Tax=Streptomyces sp. KLOTTS4A1 TaxID=3390996 RepID=UPI0039F5F4FD